MLNLLLIFMKIFLSKSLTPLSECTQGRITGYDTYKNGGACGFGPPKLYGLAPNEARRSFIFYGRFTLSCKR